MPKVEDIMIIHSYENGPRADACIEYIRSLKCADDVDKMILLPIPTTKDKHTILKTNICIYDVLDTISGHTLISGYGIPGEFIKEAEELGATVHDLGGDEEFLLDNASITAVCALGVFLCSSRLSPCDTKVGIVGYGRIGKKLTNLFLYLGATVRVYTTRPDARIELSRYGVGSASSTEGADLSGLDILINTAPATLFSPSDIPDGLRIMELASGDNFPDVPGVERYPSIPAKMFPVSAGTAWGRAIERRLIKEG